MGGTFLIASMIFVISAFVVRLMHLCFEKKCRVCVGGYKYSWLEEDDVNGPSFK